MTPKPTAVVVRLPLSEDDCGLLIDASSFGAPDDSHDKALLAIGTPVAGGELEYCAQIVWYDDAVEPEVAAWRNKDIKEGDNIKVVRQSDAQAALAAAQAENVRLREALEGAKTLHEEQDKAISKQPPSAQGQWRRHQHQEQIENIEEALKGGNL